MSIPKSDKPCFIIVTEVSRTKTETWGERDYGESWGPSPGGSRTYTVKETETEFFTDQNLWEIAMTKALSKYGKGNFYAGRVEPFEVSFSVKPSAKVTRGK